jgi:hypothetical protein
VKDEVQVSEGRVWGREGTRESAKAKINTREGMIKACGGEERTHVVRRRENACGQEDKCQV